MAFHKWWHKELRRKLTIMVIPHSTLNPVRISFSFSFLVFVFLGWTALTLWAGFVSSRHVDYMATKVEHKIMKNRVAYFAEEMKKSREFVDQVREVDQQIRGLLGMKSKEAIIEKEGGAGGPAENDQQSLSMALEHRLGEMTETDISVQAASFYRESQSRLNSFKEISDFVHHERDLYRATPTIWPAPGRLSSHFGSRYSPFTGIPEWHMGLDIANRRGTPIVATADGVVRLAGWEGGYGKLVVIDHGFGFSTRYGHASQILVKPGDRVKRGQAVAMMGSTGSSTGDHVHYEIVKNGRALNPMTFLKKKERSS